MSYKHTPEAIEKMRLAKLGNKNPRYGVAVSEESKHKMSIGRKGIRIPQEAVEKHRLALIGYKHTELTKQHMREARRHFIETCGISEETRKAQSVGRSGIKHNEETKRKLREFHLGKPLPKETREKMSKSLLKNWQKPEYRDRTIKLAMLGNHIKPNKPESFIQSLLDKMYPGEYKYVGDGSKIVGGKCPDFINESKNKVILFHGIYWHLVKFQQINPNLTKEEVESKDIAHYNKYCHDTLVVWEDELLDINSVVSKIRMFHHKVVVGSKPISIFDASLASGVLPKIGGENNY